MLRCRAAALLAPSDAVITGCSAAAVRGLELVGSHAPVELILPGNPLFGLRDGVHVRRTSRGSIDSEPWHEIRLATSPRLALDILTNTRLHISLPRVVGYLDALLRAGEVDAAELEVYLKGRRDSGIVRAKKAFRLADPRSESIPESELRVWLAVAGLEPDVQLEVFDAQGVFAGRLDLAFPEQKLAVEYDGEWHGEGDQPRHDEARRAAIQALGWRFVIVTKAELYSAPKAVVATVRGALSRESAPRGQPRPGRARPVS
ncbi:endonuclease domain-containing protein [Amycolatopsis tolypomycina]|uniref:endonuclease domain-containing protein n=1 Tax=Amycolatopsis tolypomycina TaxID=208445 RepID=UPI001FC9312F|nr:endonuclease domain-containing protein [Amycolatopsis tolypomycina]